MENTPQQDLQQSQEQVSDTEVSNETREKYNQFKGVLKELCDVLSYRENGNLNTLFGPHTAEAIGTCIEELNKGKPDFAKVQEIVISQMSMLGEYYYENNGQVVEDLEVLSDVTNSMGRLYECASHLKSEDGFNPGLLPVLDGVGGELNRRISVLGQYFSK